MYFFNQVFVIISTPAVEQQYLVDTFVLKRLYVDR